MGDGARLETNTVGWFAEEIDPVQVRPAPSTPSSSVQLCWTPSATVDPGRSRGETPDMTRPALRFPFVLSFCALLATACKGDDVTSDEADETTGDGDGDPTGDGDGDGDGDPTGDGDGDGDPTGDGDGDPSACGNGVLDPGEECDDNNTEDGDGCTASRTIGECGLTWTWTEDVASSIAGGFDVAVGDDGSVYVAGRLINADNDTWVAKWNPDGSQAWS